MEFGKINPIELAAIDFALPANSKMTVNTLTNAKGKDPFQVQLGCDRWGAKPWLNFIYPRGTKQADFFDEYVKQFDCVELNATFYYSYPPETIAKWREIAEINPKFKVPPKYNPHTKIEKR